MRHFYLKNRSFTLVELVMVIVITAILAVVGINMFHSLSETIFIYTPGSNLDMIANTILTTIIEGDSQAKGLRYAQSITTTEDNRLVFSNRDGQTVEFKIEANKLKRSINAAAFEVIPYYIANNNKISILGESGVLFTYYDSNENSTSNPPDVRRIVARIRAQDDTGKSTRLATSIRVLLF